MTGCGGAAWAAFASTTPDTHSAAAPAVNGFIRPVYLDENIQFTSA
jgi:hypothetical protein